GRDHAELAARGDPADAYETLAELMLDAGHLDDAAAFAERSLAADDSRYMSHFVRRIVAQRRGRCDEAIASFRRAIDARRLDPHAVVRNLHAGLADCLARAGTPTRLPRWGPRLVRALAPTRSRGSSCPRRRVAAGAPCRTRPTRPTCPTRPSASVSEELLESVSECAATLLDPVFHFRLE